MRAVGDLSLELAKGDSASLLGPSGSGGDDDVDDDRWAPATSPQAEILLERAARYVACRAYKLQSLASCSRTMPCSRT